MSIVRLVAQERSVHEEVQEVRLSHGLNAGLFAGGSARYGYEDLLRAVRLTVYGLSAHLVREANPVTVLFFALPDGALLEDIIRLALAFSFISQSVVCWRLGERYQSVLLAG